MDSRVVKLIEKFQKKGWRLIGSADIAKDWWFEDVILLKSTWHPLERELYLTLLTDPQVNYKKIVWAVNISSLPPECNNYNLLEQITLNDIKKISLEDVVNRINKIVLV